MIKPLQSVNGSVEVSDHLYLTVKAGPKPSFGKIMCKMEFSMAAVRKIFIEEVQT